MDKTKKQTKKHCMQPTCKKSCSDSWANAGAKGELTDRYGGP